jgi:hypothetical protein
MVNKGFISLVGLVGLRVSKSLMISLGSLGVVGLKVW